MLWLRLRKIVAGGVNLAHTPSALRKVLGELMNTPGKSDVIEAVVEILVLAALQARGAANSTCLVKSLQQTGGLPSIEEHSIRIAIRKLEASGWIRKKGSTSTPRQSEKWELTTSAKKCFPIEIRKWKSFMNDWPLISNLLRDLLDNWSARHFLNQ